MFYSREKEIKDILYNYSEIYNAHLLAEYNRIAFVSLIALLNMEEIENNIRNMLMGL